MDKQKALERLSALEAEAAELRKIIETPETPKLTPEQRFWQLCEGLELKIDREKYPDSVFFFKNGECWFEYYSKNSYLWCRYKYVWSIFENEYGMVYSDIQAMIKKQVEEHFKCKGVTPGREADSAAGMVEEHFKCKVATPLTKFKQP